MFNKKKYLNYLLILGLLCIWSWILIPFMRSDTGKMPGHDSAGVINTPIGNVNNEAGYVPHFNYADPFLKNNRSTGKKKPELISRPANKPEQVRSREENQKTEWPTIVYHGTLYNELENAQVALIKVNDESYIIRSRDLIKDLRILTVNKDSVVIAMSEETKTYQTIKPY